MSAGVTGEQMMKAWAEAQRQLLSNWLDMARAAGGSGAMPDAKVWNQTVDSWRTAVMNTLDAQTIWTRTWVDSMLKAPGTMQAMRARSKTLRSRKTCTISIVSTSRQRHSATSYGAARRDQRVLWYNTSGGAVWLRRWTAVSGGISALRREEQRS